MTTSIRPGIEARLKVVYSQVVPVSSGVGLLVGLMIVVIMMGIRVFSLGRSPVVGYVVQSLGRSHVATLIGSVVLL